MAKPKPVVNHANRMWFLVSIKKENPESSLPSGSVYTSLTVCRGLKY